MNCEEFRAAVLAGDEDTDGRAHREACPACRSHYEQLIEMRDALAEPTLWDEPSPELGVQIEALITGVARNDRPATGPRDRGGWWVAVAAVIAAVAVVGLLITTRGAAPDWEVTLPATDEAPNAVASVRGWNEYSGTRMVLEVEGLTPAPDGYMYEFWLSDGPLHISAGTFRTDGEIELWAAVPRADYPRLWVTLEPIDEDESPSPTTVLDTGREST